MVDRFLGVEEARGSNPLGSIVPETRAARRRFSIASNHVHAPFGADMGHGCKVRIPSSD